MWDCESFGFLKTLKRELLALFSYLKSLDDYYHLKIIEALLKIKTRRRKIEPNKGGSHPRIDTILAAN